MEIFDKLSDEKKERIINAAMEVFSAHGYQKASVSDIANSANISKSMIFTYFGSKLGCYEYMANEVMRISFEEFSSFRHEILCETDYFERVILAVRIKFGILKKCPPLLLFATSIYKETCEEAMPIRNKLMKEGYSMRHVFLSHGIDSAKFKAPSDAKRVNRMAEWMSAGCAEEWIRSGDKTDLEGMFDEFIDCMTMLKKHFYKEEYL